MVTADWSILKRSVNLSGEFLNRPRPCSRKPIQWSIGKLVSLSTFQNYALPSPGFGIHQKILLCNKYFYELEVFFTTNSLQISVTFVINIIGIQTRILQSSSNYALQLESNFNYPVFTSLQMFVGSAPDNRHRFSMKLMQPYFSHLTWFFHLKAESKSKVSFSR